MTFREYLQERRVKSQAYEQLVSGIMKIVNKFLYSALDKDSFKINSKHTHDYVQDIFEKVEGDLMTLETQFNLIINSYWIEHYFTLDEFEVRALENTLKEYNWEEFFSKRGHYVSSSRKEGNSLQIVVHANYDNEIKVPKVVYHVTDTKYLSSIMKNGIKPMAHNKKTKDLPRVYVALNERAVELITRAFEEYYDEQTLIEIDTTKLIKGTKFHEDNDFFKYGAWTYSHIPARALTVIE